MPTPDGGRRIRVWDLPTRLFHWLLVGLVVALVVTGKKGGLTEMDVHKVCGYAVLVLVLFRLAWGFVGSTHSRFADFVRGPGAILGYVRGLFRRDHASPPGHNPAGGMVMVVMLLVLLAQASTGLFANDDIFTEGPLAAKVGKELSDRLTGLHHDGAHAIVVLVALHVAAAFGYLLVKKENLIGPMITGKKTVPADSRTAEGRFASPWLALAIVGLAAAVVFGVVSA